MSGSGGALEADFVVVGAGSAGCVMAARLSEDPATSVILLEAGGEDTNFWIHIPLGYGKTFADKRVNWMFQTEPDPGADNRSIYWPRGKVLGGSQSINGMVYIRGQHEDFDHWRQLGNPGWSFDRRAAVFQTRRAQDRAAATNGTAPAARWRCRTPATHPICDAFIEAAVELGFPAQRRFQRREAGRRRLSTDDHAQRQALLHRGRLSASGDEAAQSARDHPRADRARAVRGQARRRHRVPRKRRAKTVRARREVILSGGAIGSPHILLLSGVGPAAHLADMGSRSCTTCLAWGNVCRIITRRAVKLRCKEKITFNDVMMNPLKQARGGAALHGVPRWAADHGGGPRRACSRARGRNWRRRM